MWTQWGQGEKPQKVNTMVCRQVYAAVYGGRAWKSRKHQKFTPGQTDKSRSVWIIINYIKTMKSFPSFNIIQYCESMQKKLNS